MTLVNERSTTTFNSGGGGSSFWGLVQQKGPWRETGNDRRNARGRSMPVLGGGIGFGGNRHAGHGNYASLSNPYQQNGSLAPPPPTQYAQRSIVANKPLDQYFRKQTAGLRQPQKPRVGSRQPMQTGHKMGSAHADQDFQGGSYGGGMGHAGTAPPLFTGAQVEKVLEFGKSPLSPVRDDETMGGDMDSDTSSEFPNVTPPPADLVDVYAQELRRGLNEVVDPFSDMNAVPYQEAFNGGSHPPHGFEFLGHSFAHDVDGTAEPMEVLY